MGPTWDQLKKYFKTNFLRSRRSRDRKNKWPFSGDFSLLLEILVRTFKKLRFSANFVVVFLELYCSFVVIYTKLIKTIQKFSAAAHFYDILCCLAIFMNETGPSEARPTLERKILSNLVPYMKTQSPTMIVPGHL